MNWEWLDAQVLTPWVEAVILFGVAAVVLSLVPPDDSEEW